MPLYLKDKLVSGTGTPGKSAYEAAKEGGYAGTEEEFNQTLTSIPNHITDTENPHSVTAVQVGADVAGAANEALNSAKAYTDQIVAGVIPGDGSKESPADSDSIFIYDNSDSGKPKKTLISKLVELFNNTFYTKTETNTLLQNNDPRNWGLGTDAVDAPDHDADKIDTSGLFRAYLNCPIDGSGWWLIKSEKFNSDKYQWAIHYRSSGGYSVDIIAFRSCVAGVYQPWEFLNPPMVLGVEYRTTERYQGKPVYVRVIEAEFNPAGTVKKTSDKTVSASGLVRFSAVRGGWSFPSLMYGGNYEDSGNIQVAVQATSDGIHVFTWSKTRDMTSATVNVQVYYTKD